jgi:hypothetical protein
MVAQAVARKHHINGIRCRRTIPHVVRCCAWWLRLDRLPNSGGSSAAGERQGRPHRQFANRPHPIFRSRNLLFWPFCPWWWPSTSAPSPSRTAQALPQASSRWLTSLATRTRCTPFPLALGGDNRAAKTQASRLAGNAAGARRARHLDLCIKVGCNRGNQHQHYAVGKQPMHITRPLQPGRTGGHQA